MYMLESSSKGALPYKIAIFITVYVLVLCFCAFKLLAIVLNCFSGTSGSVKN